MAENIKPESEPTAEEKALVEAKNMEVKRSANYHSAYANVASSGVTTQDIRITFGLITEIEPKKVGIEEQFSIHLPPAFAHSVAELIMRQLKLWEKLYLPEGNTVGVSGEAKTQAPDEDVERLIKNLADL
jgi:hypothetical protein